MEKLPEYLPIKTNPKLVRHTKSMGVVNIDNQSRQHYISQKDKILKDKREIEQLKNDVSELKEMVQILLNEKKKFCG